MTIVALYARVSSDRQAQENTIASQIDALKNRISADGCSVLDDYQFIDNGYTGSNLVRPGLEKLRDNIAAGAIDKVYIHSPDRLSRKYAYQMILVEEFEKSGVDIVFLNHQNDNANPESNLLLQMQGMISEYERSKIMERHRRGRIYAAKRGSVNVFSGAPYGYRYIDKHAGQGEASYEIIEEEAQVVRQIFYWVGRERMTMGQVVKLLKKNKILTKKGKSCWDRGTLWYMLKNTTYKGEAAFGKRKIGPRIGCVRPRKDSSEQPKNNSSCYCVEQENWIIISVPPLIDKELFEAVQEQLLENKARARGYNKGSIYLLQGLVMCMRCSRAYCGNKKTTKARNGIRIYTCYRCTGSFKARDLGERCQGKAINAAAIEPIVWHEVKNLLKNPQRLYDEYQRRLTQLNKSPVDDSIASLKKKKGENKKGYRIAD